MENPVTPSVRRIDFLGVPFDILPEESFDTFFEKLLERNAPFKIALLRYRDFRRAAWNREFQTRLWSCGLVLPIDKSLEWGMRFAGLPVPTRYHPFDFLIKLLGWLERKGKSVYILGGTPREVQQVFDKVRSGFTRLNVVGRHAGRYPREAEPAIIKAISKASPTLIFVGSRVRGNYRFLFEALAPLDLPLAIQSKEAFDIMSGRIRLPDRDTFKRSFRRGTYYTARVFWNPLKWLRLPGYLIYFFMALWQKYFRKPKA